MSGEVVAGVGGERQPQACRGSRASEVCAISDPNPQPQGTATRRATPWLSLSTNGTARRRRRAILSRAQSTHETTAPTS